MLISSKGKETFQRVADNYDTYRPSYPIKEVMTALNNHILFESDTHILELGCGTGQLTHGLLTSCAHITALDFSADMIRVAKQKFQDKHNISFNCGAFEDFVSDICFDMIIAATSFHWIDKEIRLTKSYELLKKNGYLVLIQNMGAPAPESLWNHIQTLYSKIISPELMKVRKDVRGTTEKLIDEIDASILFDINQIISFPHIHRLSAQDYISYIETLSFEHNLPENTKVRLYPEIMQMILDAGGYIDMDYEARMIFAKKV